MHTVHTLRTLGFVLAGVVVAACSARTDPRSNTKGLDGQGNPNGNPNGGDPSSDDPSSSEGSDNGPGPCTMNTVGDASSVTSGWRAMAKMSDFGLEDRMPGGAFGKAELYTWGGVALPTTSGTVLADGGAFEPLSNTWTRLPDAPIVGRSGHVQLWTPLGFFVWGGGHPQELLPGERAHSLKDGAIFDPCTKTWTKVPDAPLSDRGGAMAVWSQATGEVIVYGGGWASPIHELADGAAYNPSTGTWRNIAVNPFMDAFYGPGTSKLVGFTGTMANGKLVVYGGVPNHAKAESDAFIVPTMYDPVTDTWTRLAAPPMSPGFSADAVTTGTAYDSASFIGRNTINFSPGTVCPLGDGASFDPASNAWTYIEPEGMTRTQPAAWWGAGKLWAWGGTDCSFTQLASGASYDFGSKTWTPMPAGGPTGGTPSAWWTGSEGIVWSANGGGIYRP